MFHRPIATVLSSVSVRSLLSSRLYCAPTDLSDEEIVTVRTTGIRWTKDDVYGTINGIYWGEGDSRNTKVVRNQDTTNSRYAQLQSIMMALEQAKNDGLKQIRVLTDSEMNEFSIRAEAKMFSNLDPAERKKLQYSNMVYCEQIANSMDEMEVTLEHQMVSFSEREKNMAIDLLKEEDQKKQNHEFSKHSLDYKPQRSEDAALGQGTSEVNDVERNLTDDDQITTVRTTGMRWMRESDHLATSAVYWGEDDPRNTKEVRNYGSADYRGSRLRSILIALEQAQKDGLKRVRVQTDLDINESGIRSEAEKFKSMDLINIKEEDSPKFVYCVRLAKIMDEMEVIFEYRHPMKENSELNEVVALLNVEREKYDETANFNSPDYKSDWIITPSDASPLHERTVPTVYVTGRMQSGNQNGTTASLWVPESIEHLAINQRPRGSVKRVPISYIYDVQMRAVWSAIKEAQSFNIPEIRVITDSLYFIHFFKNGWQKQDGRPSAGKALYLDIKALTEKTKVHFKGVKLSKDCDDELMKKVYEKAKIRGK